jgi:hypothetical protein
MLNQPKNEKLQQPEPSTPEGLRQFLLAELEASKQTIEALNDKQLEEVVGGVRGKILIGNQLVPVEQLIHSPLLNPSTHVSPPASHTSTVLSGPPPDSPRLIRTTSAPIQATSSEHSRPIRRALSAKF